MHIRERVEALGTGLRKPGEHALAVGQRLVPGVVWHSVVLSDY